MPKTNGCTPGFKPTTPLAPQASAPGHTPPEAEIPLRDALLRLFDLTTGVEGFAHRPQTCTGHACVAFVRELAENWDDDGMTHPEDVIMGLRILAEWFDALSRSHLPSSVGAADAGVALAGEMFRIGAALLTRRGADRFVVTVAVERALDDAFGENRAP